MIFALGFLGTPLIGTAQQLSEESRVRVRITGELANGSVIPSKKSQAIVGRFLAMDDEHLILAVGKPPQSIRLPRSAVTSVEMSRGRSRLKGALIGAGVGGLVGVVWGLVAYSQCKSEPSTGAFSIDLCGLEILAPVVTGPSVGAVVGLVIGKEQWAKVPPTTLGLVIKPAAGGVQIAGTLKF